jgi:RNA polymerase sigma factor (sigma-70 family)
MGASEDDTLEDARLARCISEGPNAGAEALLCARLFPRIRAYGLLHLRDSDDAVDLAQHVLVVLIESLRAKKVRDLDRFSAFVSGTCRNTTLDWRKTERRRRALLDRFGPSFASVVEPAARIAGKRLEQCLAALAPRERTILALTYFADFSGAEIASELEMSPTHVRVARYRALEQLHECLGGRP